MSEIKYDYNRLLREIKENKMAQRKRLYQQAKKARKLEEEKNNKNEK